MTNEQLPAEKQNVAREVLDFAQEIMDIAQPLAPSGVEAVGIALDWLRYYRYRDVLVIRDRVNEIYKERGITTKVSIPARLGIPLLEAASMEDDPTLQEMWAGLVANARTQTSGRMQKKFSLISSQMSSRLILLSFAISTRICTRFLLREVRRSSLRKPRRPSASTPRRSMGLCTTLRASDV